MFDQSEVTIDPADIHVSVLKWYLYVVKFNSHWLLILTLIDFLEVLVNSNIFSTFMHQYTALRCINIQLLLNSHWLLILTLIDFLEVLVNSNIFSTFMHQYTALRCINIQELLIWLSTSQQCWFNSHWLSRSIGK